MSREREKFAGYYWGRLNKPHYLYEIEGFMLDVSRSDIAIDLSLAHKNIKRDTFRLEILSRYENIVVHLPKSKSKNHLIYIKKCPITIPKKYR